MTERKNPFPVEDDHVQVTTRTRVQKPPLFRVLLLNDDFTPMDFVILILERFFAKGHEEAVEIMMAVHTSGIGVCGVYPRDVAELKAAQVMNLARYHQHPLQCAIEKE